MNQNAVDEHVHLVTDGMRPEMAFQVIDVQLRQGRRVRASGSLFRALAAKTGEKFSSRYWIGFTPVSAVPPWICRLRDTIAATLALLALFPLFAVIALLVKLSSPGPILYSTKVLGQGERPFTWYKFRTMRVVPSDEDERQRRQRYREYVAAGPCKPESRADYKTIDESRVTTVGRILRRHSLDELPQLFNVIRGQMSLVGPRPCLPYEADLFPSWSRRRFDVSPGLTGVWQVYGRTRVGFDESLAMDVYYVYARSLWLDLRLILRTLGMVLSGQGGR